MPELQPLRGDHSAAVLAFELANRPYFAQSISDRGDAYFAQFGERYRDLVADQAAGNGAYYVLVDDDGSVLGRFNLIFTQDRTADLGYRVAQRVAGQGVATATVQEVCRLASVQHGLHTIRAATSHANVASSRVLVKAGFVPDGPAGPDDLGGKTGTWYVLDLTALDP